MKTKIAYQFDRAGLFAGETHADESPMEEGVFLLPGGCTFAPPPAPADGTWPRWNGNEWLLVNRPTLPDQVESPLAKLQTFLHANPDVAALLDAGG